ncbi:hypothetical protein DMX10_31445 [Pseudomonas sp. 57B-090624]|nr:hypothetical protein DMX10_31445 [Pseudomonas sp. 57B-090624]
MGMPQLAPEDLRDRDYPVHESMRVQRRLWALERIGSWLLLLVVLLTLLGLFSKGVLSSVEARGAQGRLHVDYERFLRNGATSTLVIDIKGKPGEALSLELEGEMLEGSTVESIHPQPESGATHRNTGLSLRLQPDAQGHVRVHLGVRADGVGLYRSRILGGGETIDLSQFIYP